MTTYNGQKYIIDQLDSIRLQSMPVDEVIICDDLSTDNTVNLVVEYIEKHNLHSWKIIINEVRLGFCMNFWKSIDLCTGEIVFLSDQDDVWYSDKVLSMVSVMKKDSKINFVASSYDICDDKGRKINIDIPYGRTVNNDELEDIELDYLIGRSPIRGCSICFKKELINSSHYIELKNGLAHDWLIACLATLNCRAVFYNKILFKYRVHDNNTSSPGNKFNIKGFKEKNIRRIEYLLEEENGLNVLLSNTLNNITNNQIIKEQIIFNNLRIKLVEDSDIMSGLILIKHLNAYSKIFSKGIFYGLRLYISDIAFALAARLIRMRDKIYG